MSRALTDALLLQNATLRYLQVIARTHKIPARLNLDSQNLFERIQEICQTSESLALAIGGRDLIQSTPLPEDTPATAWLPEDGVDLIRAERLRQFSEEELTASRDDAYQSGELVRAAGCYLHPGIGDRFPLTGEITPPPLGWPWHRTSWKPTPDDRIRELVKAGALIAAEIDRLQRLERKHV